MSREGENPTQDTPEGDATDRLLRQARGGVAQEFGAEEPSVRLTDEEEGVLTALNRDFGSVTTEPAESEWSRFSRTSPRREESVVAPPRREALNNLLNRQVFGRTVREIVTDTLTGIAVGSLVKGGLILSGIVTGGPILSALGGYAVGGVRGGISEIRRITKEREEDLDVEQLSGNIFAKYKAMDRREKRRVHTSIFRGAVFGMVGGIIGAEWIGPKAGELLSGLVTVVSEHLPKFPWQVPLSFIEPGRYSPKITIPDNAQVWIKDANNFDGVYAKSIQAEVGKYYQGTIDKAVEQLLSQQGKTPADLSQSSLEGMRNHMLHIMEDQGNRAFDSHLADAVKNNIALDQMKEISERSYVEWLNSNGMNDLVNGGKEFLEVDNQIHPLGNLRDTVTGLEGVQMRLGGNMINAGEILTNGFFLDGKENPQQLGALIAVNYDMLFGNWKATYPDLSFPAYLGEILYLIQRADGGDTASLERLRWIFKMAIVNGDHFEIGMWRGAGDVAKLPWTTFKDNPELILRILRKLS